MTAKYIAPSVEVIQEDSEDDPRAGLRGKGDNSPHETRSRQVRTSEDTMMVKTNTGKERDKRRAHKSGGSKHSKAKAKDEDIKRASGRYENERPRLRHRFSLSNKFSNSTSSSEEEETPQNHMTNARARLTSPSLLSNVTAITNNTNKSSGSSGSNSTITQASITKRSLGKRPDISASPVSPAVPDAPDVFSFLVTGSTTSLVDEDEEHDHIENEESQDEIEPEHLPESNMEVHESEEEIEDENHNEIQIEINNSTEEDSPVEDDEVLEGEAESEIKAGDKEEEEEEEGEEEEEEEEEEAEGDDDDDDGEEEHEWESHEYTPSPTQFPPKEGSASTSASSSTHGSDHLSEHAVENDTDRSTSPERSIDDHPEEHQAEHQTPDDTASAKIAAQIAAAHQRQNLYANSTVQSFGTPNMARGTAVYPYVPQATSITPRYTQHVKQRSLPRAEKLPVTGYELLATRLSHANVDSEGGKIKPMYRKFEALNHRLLLHLQDEISELEERLHRLDHADTQARTAGTSVVPASRRAAQAAGGDLQWHKTDVLGRIGFKLAQYNQALAAFNTTQSLNPPDPNDISTYRTYLSQEQPIAESETHFLDPTDDLVSVCSERVPHSNYSFSPESPTSPETQTSYTSSVDFSQQTQIHSPQPTDDAAHQSAVTSLAASLAIAFLVPILTFSVIPGFIGRMTVVALVAGGAVFTLMQSGVLVSQGMVGRDGLLCAGVYLGVMSVVATIVG